MYYFIVAGICAAALAVGFIAEYVFAILPCPLCVYERMVFAALGVVLLLGGLAVRLRPICRRLGFMVALGGVGLTFFHTGVEEKWWPAPAHCRSGRPAPVEPSAPKGNRGSLEQMERFRDSFKDRQIVPCDRVNWRIFGISAVVWTLMLFIALVMLIALI